MNDFMGDIRSVLGTVAPDPLTDYDGHAMWWRTFHRGYEGFCLQGLHGCEDNGDRYQSIREFEGVLRNYLDSVWPEWRQHFGRLSRMSLYKRSNSNERITPINDKYSPKYDASEKKYRMEYRSRMGISNALAEIMAIDSVTKHVEGLPEVNTQVDVIIGLGFDKDLMHENYYGSYEIRNMLNEASIANKSCQNKIKYQLGPFLDLWKDDEDASHDLYKRFGENLWNGIGKNWFMPGLFSWHQNCGFEHNECGIYLSIVREDHFRRMESLETGRRWLTKEYFQSSEGSSIFTYMDWADHFEDDSGHSHAPENRLESIQYYSENSKFMTAIYGEDGLVTIIEDKFVDVKTPEKEKFKFFLDCYE